MPSLSMPTRRLASSSSPRIARPSGEPGGTSSRPLLRARQSSTVSPSRRACSMASCIAAVASAAAGRADHRARRLDPGPGGGGLVADGVRVGAGQLGPCDGLGRVADEHVDLGEGGPRRPRSSGVVERVGVAPRSASRAARGGRCRPARRGGGRRTASPRCGRRARPPPAPTAGRCRGPRRGSSAATPLRWRRRAAPGRSGPRPARRRRAAAPGTCAPWRGTWARPCGRSRAPRRSGRRRWRDGRGRRS